MQNKQDTQILFHCLAEFLILWNWYYGVKKDLGHIVEARVYMFNLALLNILF